MACSQGALARLYVASGDSPHSFGSETYEFLSESLQKKGTVVHPNGIRGTRSQAWERARLGPYTVGGSILFNPDPQMLDSWIPRILGAAASGTTFAVAETLPAFGVLVNKVAQTFEYKDCKVSRATFAGQANQFGGTPQPISMNIEVAGKDRVTGTSSPISDIAAGANNAPYIFEDGVCTIGGTARQILSFVLMIDNNLQVRFTNSLTATSICPQGRSVYLRLWVPFSSDTPITSLIDQSITGATVVLTFTNGNMSFSISMTKVNFENIDPVITGKQEITLELGGFARSLGVYTTGTKEIVVTNDSTP